jgi:CheY-like chemotaxis protein
VMRRFLEGEGFLVATASDGQEGLRLAGQLRPAVITLDVLMPQGIHLRRDTVCPQCFSASSCLRCRGSGKSWI